MKQLIIEVPGMQSEHCQLRVKQTLQKIGLESLITVKPGSVSLAAENEHLSPVIKQAIENAGYPVASIQVNDVNTTDKTYQFKTNINCGGCVASVKPHLENAAGICHWEVDTASKDKTLTVHSNGISESEIVAAVSKAGFKIEPLKTESL